MLAIVRGLNGPGGGRDVILVSPRNVCRPGQSDDQPIAERELTLRHKLGSRMRTPLQ
jgi:hypothetical protein